MVEIVSAHTDLRRQGVRYTGLCPFHDERSPSFSVQSEEKLYNCFGCGVGGDLFDFVIAIENVDFPTAVESLAERYGVEVKREDEDPQAEERRKARQRLTELMERTASFYSSFFGDAPEAAKAREYLAGRGLDPVYGARPLRRLIQRELEGDIARAMLARTIGDGGVIRVDVESGRLHV